MYGSAKSEVIDSQQPLYGAAKRAFPKSAKNVRRDFQFLSKGKHRHSPHTPSLTLSPPHSRHAQQTTLGFHAP